MKAIFERLFEGENLERQQAYDLMTAIGRGDLKNEQIAALLTIYGMRTISLPEFAGFRSALFDLSTRVTLDFDQRIDIVGSGGDGKNTFNISTLSCFVVAGAGYKVSKHGNYASTSISGSSNVLQALGYQFTKEEDQLNRHLDEANLCFLHAPLFHPALGKVAPVRKALPFKTFFNIMGPTINPSQPSSYLLGANSPFVTQLYAEVMQDAGYAYTVVHAEDGYDEISLTGSFLFNNGLGTQTIHPSDWNLPILAPESLYSGKSIEAAAKIFVDVLSNESTEAQKMVVIANSAVAIQTLCPDKSIEDCLAEASVSIESGKAKQILERITTL